VISSLFKHTSSTAIQAPHLHNFSNHSSIPLFRLFTLFHFIMFILSKTRRASHDSSNTTLVNSSGSDMDISSSPELKFIEPKELPPPFALPPGILDNVSDIRDPVPPPPKTEYGADSLIRPSPFSADKPAEIRVEVETVVKTDPWDRLSEVHAAREAIRKEEAAIAALDAATSGAALNGKKPLSVRFAVRTANYLKHTHWIASQNPCDQWEDESSSGWTDYSAMVNNCPSTPSSPVPDAELAPSFENCGEHPGLSWGLNSTLTPHTYVRFLIPHPVTGRHLVAPFTNYDLNRGHPEIKGTFGRGYPVYRRTMRAAPVSYLCPPLTPAQITLFDREQPFATAFDKVVDTHFPIDIQAAVRQFQYFKEKEYSLQAKRQEYQNREMEYLEKAVCVLSDLENANFLGRFMSHVDIMAEEMGSNVGAHINFGKAVRGFENEVTISATDTTINQWLSRNKTIRTVDPRTLEGKLSTPLGYIVDSDNEHPNPKVANHLRSTRLYPISTAASTSMAPKIRQLGMHASKRCHKCRKMGHIRANCPLRRK
jgi:hypothetical protein